MTRFVVRRLVQSALLLWAIMTVSFFLVHAAPGGPELALLSDPRVTQDTLQRTRERFGLNDPLPIQYLKWLRNAALLDFGRSYAYQRPVVQVIVERAWPTLQLGALSYAIALLGIPLGLFAARQRARFGDNAVRLLTVVGSAVPTWWLALGIIVLLSSSIGWFPNGQGSAGAWDWLRHIILPALLLGLGGVIGFTRFVRSEVLEVLGQDYIRTARAKGLTEARLTRAHVLRNALLPVVTLLGSLLPALLSGSV